LNGHNNAKHCERRRFIYGHGLIKCVHCGYSITAELHKQRYTYYRCSQLRYRKHSVEPAWVREEVIESQIIAMLEKLTLPKEVYDWAMAYLDRVLARDLTDTQNELGRLKRRSSETQATLDALLLKAAQTEDNLAEGFMQLANQKQHEVALLQQRIEQIKAGKQENSRDAVKIIELAQHLVEGYVTFPPPQKRQIVDSVFSNLQLEDANLCGNYRLPFSILAKNSHRPLNSG